VAKPKAFWLDLSVFPTLKAEIKKRILTLNGQALVVFNELRRDVRPRLAETITTAIGSKLETTQEPNRVILYYLMIFEKWGIVKATLSTSAVSGDIDKLFAEKFALTTKVESDNDDDEIVDDDVNDDDNEA
jgi:hypothetical protein